MREEGRGERREIVRKRRFLLASSYSLYYSLWRKGWSIECCLPGCSGPCMYPELEAASSSWRVRGWKKV
jgi:hypothetical protein